MRRCPYIFVSIFLVFVSVPGIFLCAQENQNSVRLSELHKPMRMEELDASPVLNGFNQKNPFPILYPGEFSFFSLIDYADPAFKSLEVLKKLPVKNNFSNFNLKKILPSKKASTTNKYIYSENSAAELDPVIEFVQSSPNKSLPSDDELKSFLRGNTKKSQNDLTPQKSIPASQPIPKTFAEFRTEAESSLISKIFNRSSSKKTPVTRTNHKDSVPSPTFSAPNADIFPEEKSLQPVISSTLKLRAKKPNTAGQLEPAQASEFYLTTQNLNELLQNLEAGAAVEGELQSVAEIWAKAEKNASQAPEVALGVKSILLQAKVSKARTDPFGEAALRGVQPDEKYFLIGIDKDVQSNVVTIWSKEVAVEPGENVVELSSSDVIYQE